MIKQLLLFDIDGTLVQGNSVGRGVMAFALAEVFGTSGPIANYSLAGKTDLGAISDLMSAAGIDQQVVEARLADVYGLMAERGRVAFAGAMHPLPGVAKLLCELRRYQHIVLGLLTGNSAATAPLKLAAAGISPDQLRAAAYGSDHKERDRLPAVAIERALMATGHAFAGRNTILIGDTPADIQCARAIGATAIAVATGFARADELTAHSPDILLPDLTDTAGILQLLTTA